MITDPYEIVALSMYLAKWPGNCDFETVLEHVLRKTVYVNEPFINRTPEQLVQSIRRHKEFLQEHFIPRPQTVIVDGTANILFYGSK